MTDLEWLVHWEEARSAVSKGGSVFQLAVNATCVVGEPNPSPRDHSGLSALRLVMLVQHPRNTSGDTLGGAEVEKLVGAVRVGLWAEDAGDDELCLREPLTQHGHERDGPAFAHVARRLAEELD